MLGAGPLQLPLIQKAVDRGWHVVTLDYLPDNVGHRVAHASVCASTRDVDAVLAAARHLDVDAVLTASSDVAIPALAAVCAGLGLPGPSTDVARAWFPKDALRAFQERVGLPHPRFISGTSAADLLGAAGGLGGALVVKPVDSSGSRGVQVVSDASSPDLRPSITRALEASACGRACIEERLPGVEYGGDALVVSGEVAHLYPTSKDMEGVVVRGHRMPAELDAAALAAIHSAVQAHVEAAGYRDGPLNIDVMLGDDGVARIIELSPRLGGNWIPQLIAHAVGADLFAAALDLAAGISPKPAAHAPRRAGCRVLGAGSASTVCRVPTLDELREEIPNLVDLAFDVRVGDEVAPFADSGAQIGRALFDLEGHDEGETRRRLDRAVDAMLASGAPAA